MELSAAVVASGRETREYNRAQHHSTLFPAIFIEMGEKQAADSLKFLR
jgi:hypothetical protein